MKYLLAIIFPPLGVIAAGGDAKQILISLVLCALGYAPGVIYALYVCVTS